MRGEATTILVSFDPESTYPFWQPGALHLRPQPDAIGTRYVYAGSRRIARIAGDSASYYLADHLGSTRSLVDEEGAVTATYDYWPYGKGLASSGAESTRFRFTGHERDLESSLDYMLERSYAYDVGRFLRPDPMQDEYPGISPYAYAANNPLKYTDPDGRIVFPAVLGLLYATGVTPFLWTGYCLGFRLFSSATLRSFDL